MDGGIFNIAKKPFDNRAFPKNCRRERADRPKMTG
jgi:hypothetical protein